MTLARVAHHEATPGSALKMLFARVSGAILPLANVKKKSFARVAHHETTPGSAPKMMFARVSGVLLPLANAKKSH